MKQDDDAGVRAGSGPVEVLELRQYTVRGGMRDVLPTLFRTHFIAEHEAVGARILGTYFDLDDPDRFVWLRSYTDITMRGAALRAFYGDDEHDGKRVLVRYLWSEITSRNARWEQAFSPDGGATWETNWTMRFKRLDG